MVLDDQYAFPDAVAKARAIADGPGFVEQLRDRNRAAALERSDARRTERELNRGDYGSNQIYDGAEVYQPPRTSLIDQIRTGRTDTPDLTDALAAALGYVYDGTVNGYVGKGAVIANDYLRSLPSAVYDLLGMSFKPAGAATMDSVAGQALSVNDMKTVIQNNAVSDNISSALRGGFDSSKLERERGILPSGPQVANLGPITNEQLRQYNQGFITAGDRYAMTMGGRGLRGTRPEGFGDQNLGFVAQDAPAPFQSNMRDRNMTTPGMVDPRDPNFRGSYQGNVPPSNMQGPNPTPQLDAYNRGEVTNPRIGYESGQDDLNRAMIDGRIPLTDYSIQPETGRYVGPANIPNRVYPPSNEQGLNFTPDSIDPRGPSQIPDSRRPFPASSPYDASFPREPAVSALGTQPVGTQMLPNVGGTSGRLQDFRSGDPFKPISGDSAYARDAFPDNVTDSSTRASTQLTGPTTENYGTTNFNAYGEGVTPGLRQGDVIPYSPNMRDRNMRPTGMTAPTNLDLKDPLNRFEGPKQEEILRQAQILKDRGIGAVPTSPLVGGGISPQIPATQTQGFLDSGGIMPQRAARDVPSFGDTDPINVVPANEFQLGAADAARENNLRAQAAEETFYNQQGFPSQVDTTRMMGINDPLSATSSELDRQRMIGINEPLSATASELDRQRMMGINQPLADTSSYRDDYRFGQQAGQFLKDNILPSGVMPSFQNKYPTSPVPYERILDGSERFFKQIYKCIPTIRREFLQEVQAHNDSLEGEE